MTTTKTKSQRFDTFSYSESDLQEAFESFMQEEPKTAKSPLLNFPTAIGFGMLLAAMVGVSQLLGLSGGNISPLLEFTAVFGGLSVLIVGSGLFSRKKRERKSRRKKSKASYASSPTRDRASFTTSESSDFENYWETKNTGSKSSKTSSSFSNSSKEAYALAKSKKLFKSISDKKIAGVCGGLASYLGVSSTFVRLIFIIATIMGYGSPILIYLAFALILTKEPIDLQRVRKSND